MSVLAAYPECTVRKETDRHTGWTTIWGEISGVKSRKAVVFVPFAPNEEIMRLREKNAEQNLAALVIPVVKSIRRHQRRHAV